MLSVPVRPAASRLVTVMTLLPAVSGTDADQDVVPVAVPLPPAAFDQVTLVTPTLSAAVPPKATDEVVVLQVVALVGLVMVTVGAVVSGGV